MIIFYFFTCNNSTVNTSNDAIATDYKLDTKPQPPVGKQLDR
jgi:hypothetical protein